MIEKDIDRVIIDFDNKKFVVKIFVSLFFKVVEININNIHSEMTLIK